MFGQDLHAAQFVTTPPNRHAFIERPHSAHLELAQHRKAIMRDRGTDARDHRVIALQRRPIIAHCRAVAGDIDRAAKRIENV